MTTSSKILNDLKVGLKTEMLNLTDRIEDILDDHGVNSDDIIYVKFFFEKSSPDDLMQHVIEKILPWKRQIVDRDESFFAKNKEIFGKLPQKKVNYFSDLVIGGTFNKEDKDEVWEFFDTYIAYAEEYKKKD